MEFWWDVSQGTDADCWQQRDYLCNQRIHFNKLFTWGVPIKRSVCAQLGLISQIIFFPSLLSTSPLCYQGHVLSELWIWSATSKCHLPTRWMWDSVSRPCSQKQWCFLAGKQGASFAWEAVSISSPAHTNYVSLSFTQPPVAYFSMPTSVTTN